MSTVSTGTTFVNGITYQPGETIPDMGSLVCINIDNGKREYRGLSADFDKLPISGIPTGSSCFMYDTSACYEFCEYNHTWYKL